MKDRDQLSIMIPIGLIIGIFNPIAGLASAAIAKELMGESDEEITKRRTLEAKKLYEDSLRAEAKRKENLREYAARNYAEEQARWADSDPITRQRMMRRAQLAYEAEMRALE